MTTQRICFAVAAAGLLLAAPLQAQPTAHYLPGIEGIKAASLPPPGFYVRDYNVFYFADRMNDSNGDEIGAADPDAFLYANVPRVIWITDLKVLGGFIGIDALLPLQYTDLEVNTGPASRFDDSTFGIGDLFAEVTWSAHPGPFDLSLAYGVWAPTGDSSPSLSTRAGLGYWGHMFTAGATWYIDSEKRWALSALNRYEINTEKEDTDVTPGDSYTLEWGASYAIMKNAVDIGVVGYYQRQMTSDDGADTDRDQVAAIGPEISAFCKELKLNTSLRYLYEFSAENRLQGHTVALTLTKMF